ncbi:MAG: hypothetical protein ABI743_07980 [bacterium]
MRRDNSLSNSIQQLRDNKLNEKTRAMQIKERETDSSGFFRAIRTARENQQLFLILIVIVIGFLLTVYLR